MNHLSHRAPALSNASNVVEGMTQILRADRTAETIERGLRTLCDAPLNAVGEALIFHRVGPALFALLDFDGETRNENRTALRRLLKSHYDLSHARLNVAREVTTEVVGRLDDAGIQPLLLRGITLADSLYPDPAMRPFGDVDVVVRPDEYECAVAALSSFPCVSRRPQITILAVRSENDTNADMAIEIHHYRKATRETAQMDRLLNGGVFGAGELERVYAVSELSKTPYGCVRQPPDEALLPHLCRHFSKHLFYGSASLLSLLDIAFLVCQRGSALRWDRVMPFLAQPDRMFGGNALYAPMLMSGRWLGASVPSDILEQVRRATKPSVRIRAEREAASFGAETFGSLDPKILSVGRWIPWWQMARLLAYRAVPSVESLKIKGLLDGETSPTLAYARWYRQKATQFLHPLASEAITRGNAVVRRLFPAG